MSRGDPIIQKPCRFLTHSPSIRPPDSSAEPWHTRAGQVGQPIDAAGVEPVQPRVDHLGVPAQPPGDFGDVSAVPACGDDAGALNPAGRRVPGSSELAQPALLGGVAGGRACRSAGMVSRVPYGHDHGASNLTLVPDLGTQREAGDLGRPAEAAVRAIGLRAWQLGSVACKAGRWP
jgi:hypothetical protein